jgi:hypothetical protein
MRAKLGAVDSGPELDRAAMWTEYTEILRRGEDATSKDVDRFCSLVEMLGIDPRVPELHKVIIDEADSLAIKVDRHPEFVAKKDAAEAEARALQNEIAALRTRFETACRIAEETRSVVYHNSLVTQTLDGMIGLCPQLFTENGAEAEVDVVSALRRGAPAELQRKARELGLL